MEAAYGWCAAEGGLLHLVSIKKGAGRRAHYTQAGTLWMRPLWGVWMWLCKPDSANSNHTLTFKLVFGKDLIILLYIYTNNLIGEREWLSKQSSRALPFLPQEHHLRKNQHFCSRICKYAKLLLCFTIQYRNVLLVQTATQDLSSDVWFDYSLVPDFPAVPTKNTVCYMLICSRDLTSKNPHGKMAKMICFYADLR